jgi:hypothetical protein
MIYLILDTLPGLSEAIADNFLYVNFAVNERPNQLRQFQVLSCHINGTMLL